MPTPDTPEARRAVNEAVECYLISVWEDRCDEANAEGMRYAAGVIDGLKAVGILTKDAHELWARRFKECPGHDPCRRWCAYCGDIPHDEDCDCDLCAEVEAQAMALARAVEAIRKEGEAA